ncbi:MAG TPA: M12 family metallopeptidase [Polyangiaceae bacterium]
MKQFTIGVGAASLLSALMAMACSVNTPGSEVELMEGELSAVTREMSRPQSPKTSVTKLSFCFPGSFATDAKYATFRRASLDAAKEWENATDRFLVLTPIPKCGSGIEIRMDKMEDQGGYTDIGPNSEPVHVNLDYIDNETAIKRVVLHELGHKLGFSHEHVHPNSNCPKRQKDTFLFWEFETDTVGFSPFPYDASSTMNYCRPSGSAGATLSPGDIDNVQRLYGGNEYKLTDGRTYWLRSDLGFFIHGDLKYTDSMSSSRFTFRNVDRPGRDIGFGHKVMIQNPSGKYLKATTATDATTFQKVNVLALSDTAYVWDVSGFSSAGTIGINTPFALSGMVGAQRVFLGSDRVIRPRGQKTTMRTASSTTPPEDSRYIWRVLGPGPETSTVCGSRETRCGTNCCGSGTSCVDAPSGLCCGQFDQRCGSTCCGPDQECVSGMCQAPTTPPPPPPGTNCGAFPACSTIADCPTNYDYCNGCCRRLG